MGLQDGTGSNIEEQEGKRSGCGDTRYIEHRMAHKPTTVKALVSGINGTYGIPDIRKFRTLEGIIK